MYIESEVRKNLFPNDVQRVPGDMGKEFIKNTSLRKNVNGKQNCK